MPLPSPFSPEPPFTHGQAPRIGVIYCNLGTPDAPTAAAVRRYLAEFLSDARVVEIPKLLWNLILHGVILRTRPAKSAARRQHTPMSPKLSMTWQKISHCKLGVMAELSTIAAGRSGRAFSLE